MSENILNSLSLFLKLCIPLERSFWQTRVLNVCGGKRSTILKSNEALRVILFLQQPGFISINCSRTVFMSMLGAERVRRVDLTIEG